ncbi:MAG: hypothetical protein JNM63_06265, partial [Spirochaetia bacterium]|nr:hypothetical protein [Spirochaetia bacterium]
MKFIHLFLTSVIFLACTLSAAPSKTWDEWSQARRAGKSLPFPDFSYSGFQKGEEPIPEAKGQIFDVTRFGAIPDDTLSDKKAIRAAIAAATQAGSGIVFFPKGRFIAQGPGDDEASILISASHIVLRGSGAGPGGTEIQYPAFLKIPDPKVMWASRPLFVFAPPVDEKTRDAEISKVAADTVMGQTFVDVENGASLKAGDAIFLELASAQAVGDFLSPYEADAGWTAIQKNGIQIRERHRVA